MYLLDATNRYIEKGDGFCACVCACVCQDDLLARPTWTNSNSDDIYEYI